MSEVKYRRRLREFRAVDGDLRIFIQALLESTLLIPDQLQQILMLDDADITRHAIYVIESLRLTFLISDMIRVYQITTDRTLRHVILEVLANHQSDHIEQFLLSIVLSPGDIHLRRLATYALKRGSRPTIAVPMLAIVHDTKEDVLLRCMALKVFDNVIRRPYLPQILPLLQDTEPEVRCAVLHMVCNSGNSSLAPYIEPLLTDTTLVYGTRTIAERAEHILKAWGVIPSA